MLFLFLIPLLLVLLKSLSKLEYLYVEGLIFTFFSQNPSPNMYCCDNVKKKKCQLLVMISHD